MFSQIKRTINNTLPAFFEDEEIISPITWRRFDYSAFNEAQGINEEVYTPFEVTAIKVEKQLQSASKARAGGGVPIVTGDIVYLVRGPEIPEGASNRDIIVDGTNSYAIDKLVPIYGLLTKVEVKGYA